MPQAEETVYTMEELPAEIPVTTPLAAFTVATDVFVLLHVPPLKPVLDKVVVEPVHSNIVPFIVPAVGTGLTVTANVVEAVPQPVVTVYIMVEFPGATPVTTPVVGFIVATAVVPLDQVPPEALLLSIVVDPAHTVEAPLMVPAFASGLTVMVAEALALPQTVVTV